MSTTDVKRPALRFYYGLRSPYAWLAWRLLRRHLAPDDFARIELAPLWDPEPATRAVLEAGGSGFLYRPMARERHFYILADVRRLAGHLGCHVAWPGEPTVPHWELAHLACLAAAPGAARIALVDALFAARWEQGRDICNPAVVDAVLAATGSPLRSAALASPRLQLVAVDALRLAWTDRVFGLPYFVTGRAGYWGVDRLPFALAAAGLPWEALAHEWMYGAPEAAP